MKLRDVIVGITAAGLVVGSAATMAASEDGLGATSGGTSAVSLVIEDLVQVSGIADIDLGTYVGTGTEAGSDGMCVYRNGTGSYKVNLSSANEGGTGNFRLTDGTNFIVYAVTWDDSPSGFPSAVSEGVDLTAQGGHATALDCGAADNATMAVSVAEAALQAAPTGTYGDTITILVSPT